MPATPEVATARMLLCAAVDRVIAAAEGLDAEALNWVPAEGASSLSALALHVLGMTRENVLTYITATRSSDRVRATEFAPSAETGASLAARWAALRREVEAALEGLREEDLGQPRTHHTFGTVPARELLQRMVNHAYEHAGQAELTRQWLGVASRA